MNRHCDMTPLAPAVYDALQDMDGCDAFIRLEEQGYRRETSIMVGQCAGRITVMFTLIKPNELFKSDEWVNYKDIPPGARFRFKGEYAIHQRTQSGHLSISHEHFDGARLEQCRCQLL